MTAHTTYLVGIKGVAMTALAIYLQEKGIQVRGSDTMDSFPTDAVLASAGITIDTSFSPDLITKDFSEVVVTGAHGGMTNPQAQKALELGIPTFMHGRYLGESMEEYTSISVAGCHGKTTTSSLIAFLLMRAGVDPSYAVGTAAITGLPNPGHFGKGTYFVAEADEYVTCPVTDKTPRFLWQHPAFLVLTNIDYDHPDVYPSMDAVMEAYRKLTGNVVKGGKIIASIDDPYVKKLIRKIRVPVITYGFDAAADYAIRTWSITGEKSTMQVAHKGSDIGTFTLSIPGAHNLSNALAAIIVAHETGISWDTIRQHLVRFTGTKRRFEKIADIGAVTLYDDYAHHPKEIQATLSAARARFTGRRLIVVFQPHTYSRTKKLLAAFAGSFTDADRAIIADIYPSAREKRDPTFSSSMLVDHPNASGKLISGGDKDHIITLLGDIVRAGDVLLTMGAGDIVSWHKDIMKMLKNVHNKKNG